MKITGVRTFVVGNPTPGYGGRYFILLKLQTDALLDALLLRLEPARRP